MIVLRTWNLACGTINCSEIYHQEVANHAGHRKIPIGKKATVIMKGPRYIITMSSTISHVRMQALILDSSRKTKVSGGTTAHIGRRTEY